jgi:hypothetical protein
MYNLEINKQASPKPEPSESEHLITTLRNEEKFAEQLCAKISDDLIQLRVSNLLGWYMCRADRNKHCFIAASLLSSGLPMVVTILNLIGQPEWQDYLAAALSAIVTVLMAWISICNLQRNWIRYRKSAERIKSETTKYIGKVSPYDGADANKLFLGKLEEMTMEENNRWANEQKQKPVRKRRKRFTGDYVDSEA